MGINWFQNFILKPIYICIRASFTVGQNSSVSIEIYRANLTILYKNVVKL